MGNLRQVLSEAPGIGVVLIGEGDVSQDLGFPREDEHPTVAAAIAEILAICKEAGVSCADQVSLEVIRSYVRGRVRSCCRTSSVSNAVCPTGGGRVPQF